MCITEQMNEWMNEYADVDYLEYILRTYVGGNIKKEYVLFLSPPWPPCTFHQSKCPPHRITVQTSETFPLCPRDRINQKKMGFSALIFPDFAHHRHCSSCLTIRWSISESSMRMLINLHSKCDILPSLILPSGASEVTITREGRLTGLNTKDTKWTAFQVDQFWALAHPPPYGKIPVSTLVRLTIPISRRSGGRSFSLCYCVLVATPCSDDSLYSMLNFLMFVWADGQLLHRNSLGHTHARGVHTLLVKVKVKGARSILFHFGGIRGKRPSEEWEWMRKEKKLK